jgi:hypothetical protein
VAEDDGYESPDFDLPPSDPEAEPDLGDSVLAALQSKRKRQKLA